MGEITKVSTKGQIVIPRTIREELGLESGTSVVVAKMNNFVVLKKIDVPDVRAEFKALTDWGKKFAKERGIKSEKDVLKKIRSKSRA